MSEIKETTERNQDSERFELDSLKSEISQNNSTEQNEADENQRKLKEMIEKQKSPITHWNRNNPEISITFDDGYWPNNIKHILDTLKWSWIHATFFILWDCLRNTPELWKQAAEQWHQVCCHTFSHIYLSNNSDTTSLTTWLNKNININKRTNDVKTLLWNEYFENIKSRSWESFPNRIKSDILLETEILMWEAQIKNTLWEKYLQNLKQSYPFFRFPGWCWANRSENIAVLKKLWYLSIWWSEDFFRWTNKSRRHMSTDSIKTMDISNWSIPLFHFKSDDYKYIDAYIENMKWKGKASHEVSQIIM